MNHQNDWNEDEDNFDLTLSQRTEELYRVPNMEPNADGLIEAVVLPLRDMVIFPRMVSPIFVGREASLLAVQEAQRKEQTVIGLTQKDPEVNDPGVNDFLPVGVEMSVGRLLHMPDSSYSALVQGRRRVEIVEFIRTNEPVALGLTSQQWIAVGMIVVGFIGAWYFGTRGRLRPVIERKPAAGKPAEKAAAAGGAPGKNK